MPKHRLQNTALKVTRWVGSPQSIVAHTLVFIASFGAVWFGVLDFDRMLLILTTVVSLEAIYLAIFIQMTINQQTQVIEEVEQNIDEMQEDVEEIQEDIDELQEDEEKEEVTLDSIQSGLAKLMQEVEKMQQK